jgi:FixJ family two-component response regulator
MFQAYGGRVDTVVEREASQTGQPTVFIIDDEPAVRQSVRWLVESVALNVETFATAQEFLDKYDPSRPGCVLTDIRMPGMCGLTLQEQLRENGCIIPVIVMTGHGDVPTAVRAMKNGAVDFIEKPFNDQELLDLLHSSIQLDRRNRQVREERQIALSKYNALTPREKEVMGLVVDGHSNKEIARDLDISPKTVEAHRAKLMEKMQAGSVAELTKLAAVCNEG